MAQLVGKTTLRELVRLVYHADGVLSPVTLAMHLAAAVPAKPGKPRRRPCVVVAGGREPPHWEAYPHHQFVHTAGALPCCAEGGCWKSPCQLVGHGHSKDRHNLCEHLVQVAEDLRIPRCMRMITPQDVARRIEMYDQGGVLEYLDAASGSAVVSRSAGRVVSALASPLAAGLPSSVMARLGTQRQRPPDRPTAAVAAGLAASAGNTFEGMEMARLTASRRRRVFLRVDHISC